MKIAYILPSFSGDFEKPTGGLESATINLILGVLKVKKNAEIYLLFPNTNQKVENFPDRVTAVPIHSFFKSVWTFNYPVIGISKYLEKEIKNINPDVIHVQAAPGFYRNFDLNKTFLTVHGIPYIDSSFHKRLASRMKSFITKQIFVNDIRRYQNIIFLVNYGYTLFKDNIDPKATVHFIPNAILEGKVDFQKTKNEIPVLFFSGILRPLKNIEALIEAGYYLKKEGVKFSLQLAGNFAGVEYENEINELIRQFDLESEVIFLGQLNSNEIQNKLNNIDVNLLPSYQEVCPMSIIEAMAKGKPSIASSIGGVPEMIFNTYNGYLIPIDNAKELYNKIKSILDPVTYESMRANCFKMAETYDYVNIANRTLECYERIDK